MSLILYATGSCKVCCETWMELCRRKINFEVIDPTQDDEALHFVTQVLGHTNLPVVYLDAGQHWSGHQPDRLDTMILNRDPSLA